MDTNNIKCPVCGGKLEVIESNDNYETAYCELCGHNKTKEKEVE